MLVATVFVTFFILSTGAVVLQIALRFLTKGKNNTNPQFLSFQRSYLVIYYLIIFGDWLNAPYLYKLYSTYGFVENQIAIIYVSGYVSALAFGSTATYFVRRHGKCRVYVLATVTYAFTCLMKLSSDYTVLILGRLLSGAATSLLFCAQESWYTDAHLVTHDFPPEWIDLTFTKASLGNSLFAILAGLLTYLLCEVFTLPPVSPSVLSVPILLPSALLALSHWVKNGNSKSQLRSNTNVPSSGSSTESKKLFKTCCQQLQTIFRNSDLFQLGCIQALFESVLCLFVFLWTPVLDHHHPPLGMVFASFMASHLLGSSAYKLIRDLFRISVNYMMIAIFVISSSAVLTCALTTHPSNEFPIISYCAFLVFEMSAGMYFPGMTDLKKQLQLDQTQSSATSWFRVPLNLIACTGLILLHSSTNATGTKNLFACCFLSILCGLGIMIKLSRSKTQQTIVTRLPDQFTQQLLSEDS